MGVYVKGMTMPYNCLECEFWGSACSSGCAIASLGIPNSYNYDAHKRPDWCPLVEVSEPHGSLIDGDELKTAFPKCDNNMDIKIASVRATINHMSVIIEAEGSNDTRKAKGN